jgi:sec-independent protein translocase protein TatA
MSPSPLQIAIVVLIVLLLFGASRLGSIGKGLGEGIRNFKKGVSGDADEDKSPKQMTEGDKSDDPSGTKSETKEHV